MASSRARVILPIILFSVVLGGLSATSGACGGAVEAEPGDSPPGEGGSCSDLGGCCSDLTGNDESVCEQTVATGVASTCSSLLSALEADGLCGPRVPYDGGADTGQYFDSGYYPDGSDSADTGYYDGGYYPDGAYFDGGYYPDGGYTDGGYYPDGGYTDGGYPVDSGYYPDGSFIDGGGSTPCELLDSCCYALPSARQSNCEYIVTQDNSNLCQSVLNAYEHANLCSVGSVGSGVGTGG